MPALCAQRCGWYRLVALEWAKLGACTHPMAPYPGSHDEAGGGCVSGSSRQGRGRQAVQERQQALSGRRAARAGVAVVPPSAEVGQQVPAEHRTVHLYLSILWAPGRAGGMLGQAPGSLPFPAHPPSPHSPPSEGSESWDESRLSARTRSPPVGESSSSSRRRKLRCWLSSRPLALRALSSCSSSLCRDPVNREQGPKLGSPVASWGPSGRVPGQRAPERRQGHPPHLDVKPCTVQEAQRSGTRRPRAYRHLLLQPLQAAPELGSPAAGAGGDTGKTAVSPERATGTATPWPPPPRTCASPARCAPTCGRAPGNQNRRYRPPPPSPTKSHRSPDASHGPAGPRGAERGVAVLGLGQARRGPGTDRPALPPLQELGRLQQHLDAGDRRLHGGGGRAGRSLAVGRPGALTSARRGNKFGRESACFKFESAGGTGRATPPLPLGHAPEWGAPGSRSVHARGRTCRCVCGHAGGTERARVCPRKPGCLRTPTATQPTRGTPPAPTGVPEPAAPTRPPGNRRVPAP